MNFKELLAPIPADRPEVGPCGVDPVEDPQVYAKYKALEELVRETQEHPVPDWARLDQECTALLKKTRHLRVMVLAAVAATYRDKGLSGAQAGLEYIRDTLKDEANKFWVYLHPRLSGQDAAQRVSELNELSTALADDPPNPHLEDGTFLYYLRRRPLFTTSGGRQISARDFELAREGKQPADGPSFAEIQKARAALPAAERGLLQDSVNGMVAALDDMEKLLAARNAKPSWQRLRRVLAAIETMLAQTDGAGPVKIDTQGVATQRPAVDGQGELPSIPSGVIRHRQEAVAMLRCLCYYFQQYEPTSPVLLLLQRAQRLIGIGFLEALQDILPDSDLEAVRKTLGHSEQPEPEEKQDEDKKT